MQPTRRDYLDDPYRRQFTATVVTCLERRDGPAAVLAETCFYPEGGGQPADQGQLGPARVLDVQEEADGTIVHYLDRALAPGTHEAVIDWGRRFDHMQQHTGQHLLSRCFEILAGAGTVSFHLGSGEVTIDLDVTDLPPARITEVEELAHRVVFENRSVEAEEISAAEAVALGVTCPPGVDGRVRVVTITDFDRNACGGTHVRATGEIGPVKVRRLERVRGKTRVGFLCGWRGLRDYAWKHEAMREMAALFTTGEHEVPGLVSNLVLGRRSLERRVRDLEVELATYRACALIDEARPVGDRGYRLISHLSADGLEATRALVTALVAASGVIALAGCVEDGRARVVAAAAPDVEIDLAPIVRDAANVLFGRGGGKKNWAEAGGEDPARLEAALHRASAQVLALVG